MNNKIVLIPAYEPDNKLISLLEKLSKEDVTIIVINAGNTKEYNQIFKEAQKYAEVLEYDGNKGKGYALKYGFNYIKNNFNNNYYVVTMDSDGQHTIEDTLKLLEYVQKNPDTLILGKRLRNQNIPFRSRLGNGITRLIFSLTTGLNIYDTQTGLRAFSNKLINELVNIDGERFEYEMNVLLVFAKRKIPIKEVEITTIYIDNNSQSHFNTLKDSFLIYKEIIKFSFSSIFCFLIDFILYTLLVICFNKIILANLLARFISATINYNINKKIVFQNNDKNNLTAIKYSLLVLFIILINSLILKLFVTYLNFNKFISKLLTEILLFIFSWLIQRYFIFKKET